MPSAAFMQIALRLAARNLGQTWPNPAVGALVVRDGHIVAQGYTARGGRPHAETQALAQAGELAKGATLYVTLEPCSHQGQTPPCTDAIIKSGIKRCVVACTDPNPQVNGKGIELLEKAGIEVELGVCREQAGKLNEGFFSLVGKNRPFVSLKLATSQDGKMATRSGESKWITGERARNYGHLLRSRHDAILTGIGTVLSDDPALTCRLPGLEKRSPARVVLDRQGRLPAKATVNAKDGVQVMALADKTLADVLKRLAENGITRVMVEAGATLSTAFLQAGLVDRLYWFRAPIVIGGNGLSVFGDGFPEMLSQLARWRQSDHIILENDTLDIFECSQAS